MGRSKLRNLECALDFISPRFCKGLSPLNYQPSYRGLMIICCYWVMGQPLPDSYLPPLSSIVTQASWKCPFEFNLGLSLLQCHILEYKSTVPEPHSLFIVDQNVSFFCMTRHEGADGKTGVCIMNFIAAPQHHPQLSSLIGQNPLN